MNTKRKNQITFRLSDAELAIFKGKLLDAGCTQQEYLCKTALEKNITNTAELKELIPEMKHQGVNLNQIAKRLNERGYVDYDKHLTTTLKEVQETWLLLRQYLLTHR